MPEGNRFSEGGLDQYGIIDWKEKKEILLGPVGGFVQMSESCVHIDISVAFCLFWKIVSDTFFIHIGTCDRRNENEAQQGW